MKAPKCKLCGRNHWTYEDHYTGHSAGRVTPPVTTVTTVTPDVTPRYVRVEPLPGHPCPTCGQMVPKYKTDAERQKAYRARKAG